MEVRPNGVPSSCLDENVSLISVQKYFSPDSWGVVCNIGNQPVLYCGKCTKNETENSIACESCLTRIVCEQVWFWLLKLSLLHVKYRNEQYFIHI